MHESREPKELEPPAQKVSLSWSSHNNVLKMWRFFGQLGVVYPFVVQSVGLGPWLQSVVEQSQRKKSFGWFDAWFVWICLCCQKAQKENSWKLPHKIQWSDLWESASTVNTQIVLCFQLNNWSEMFQMKRLLSIWFCMSRVQLFSTTGDTANRNQPKSPYPTWLPKSHSKACSPCPKEPKHPLWNVINLDGFTLWILLKQILSRSESCFFCLMGGAHLKGHDAWIQDLPPGLGLVKHYGET